MNAEHSQRYRITEIAVAVALCAWVAALCCFGIDNDDIYWHLASGRELLRKGAFPVRDPFSFLLGGKPWVDEYWLFQLTALGLWNLGHETALTLFKIVWVTGLVGGLGALLHRRGVPWTVYAICAIPAMFVLLHRLTERPELFTWLFLLTFLMALPRSPTLPSWRTCLGLAFAQTLWANSHPAFLLGPAVVGIVGFGQMAGLAWQHEKSWKPGPTHLAARYGALLAIVLLASLANPYGWRLHLLPFELTHTTVFVERIAEWKSPWSMPVYPMRVSLLLLLGLSVPALAMAWRRRAATHLLLFAAFAVLGLQAVRHFALLAWVALIVNAEMWGQWWADRPRMYTRWHPRLSAAAIGLSVVLTLLTVTDWLWYWTGNYRRFGLRPISWMQPTVETDFVIDHGPAGNGFNDYNFGGYLMWRLYPARQIAVDGRLIVYGGDLIAAVLEIAEGKREWVPFFEKHDIHWALIGNEALGLAKSLWQSPDWHLVYAGPRALVFYDSSDGNRDTVQQFAIGSAQLEQLCQLPVPAPRPWWRAPDEPYTYVQRAATLFDFGRPDLALRVVELGLKGHPRNERLLGQQRVCLLHTGRIMMQQKNWTGAEDALRRLVTLDPMSLEGWNNLGVLYARTGKVAQAREAWQRALVISPNNAAVKENLDRLAAR